MWSDQHVDGLNWEVDYEALGFSQEICFTPVDRFASCIVVQDQIFFFFFGKTGSDICDR